MNTSSISRSRTSITAAPRPRAHKPTESASASIALCWMSFTGWRSAKRSTAPSTSCRPTLMRGSPNTRRIQLIVATRSLLAYRATRRPTPRSLTVTLDEFISIAGYHRKHVIWRRYFRRCWWPTNLDKHSAVLGLVQDEPGLRAGAAGGILDKTCARRSAGGRSAPRNGPLSLTKECNLDLGSGEGDRKSTR